MGAVDDRKAGPGLLRPEDGEAAHLLSWAVNVALLLVVLADESSHRRRPAASDADAAANR